MAELKRNTKIPLKKLSSINDLTSQEIKAWLLFCREILSDPYNNYEKRQRTPLRIEGFKNQEFLLTKGENLSSYVDAVSEPFLLISDIISFVEQIRLALPNHKIKLTADQKQYLDKIGSAFDRIGISVSDDRIDLENLERLERNPNATSAIIASEFILDILEGSGLVDEEVEEEKEEEKEEESKIDKNVKTALSAAATVLGREDDTGDDTGLDQEDEDKEEFKDPKFLKEERQQRPFDEDFNLARLDPQSKLYIQSLSIITINQSLNRYFDKDTLNKLGLKEVPTFDQLPLAVRKSLMNSSFAKVEALLASGNYNFDDLIKNASSRIAFTQHASIDLMMDINAINVLNRAVHDIAKLEKFEAAASLKKNEAEKDASVSSSEKAEQFFSKNDKEAAELVESLNKSLANISERDFIEKLSILVEKSGRDATGADILIRQNLIPTIETLIQEGFPPEYIKHFDYHRFVFYFGTDLIDQKTFEEYQESIKELLIVYWKGKRAAWAADIRREVAYERIDGAEAEDIWKEIVRDEKQLKKHAAQLQYHRKLNLDYGGKEITEVLAGKETDDPILKLYQEAQQSTHLAELKAQFNQYLKEGSQRATAEEISIFYRFYFPTQELNIETFTLQTFNQVAPQFSPYDLYAMGANQSFGQNAFQSGGPGYSSQLRQGSGLGQKLKDSPVGDAANKLAQQGLKYGLRAGIGAATGGASEAAFQAWEAAKKANPMLQEIEDQVLGELVNQSVTFIKKNWPILLIGSAFALLPTMLPILIPLGVTALLAKNGFFGKVKDIFTGGGSSGVQLGSASSTINTAAEQVANTKAAAKTAATAVEAAGTGGAVGTGLASSAMATAGQAVIGTAAAAATLTLFYKTSLNSAFLTHFPMNDTSAGQLVEKTSKYARVEKNAKIVSGCPGAENNGTKCENPNFPITIEYEVTISPKEDYTIQVTNIEDVTKFKQSTSAWEELEGRVPPTIPESRTLGLNDFEEIDDPTQIILEPGEELTLNYRLEDLGSDYNHTAIINTVEVKFYYENSFESGTDNMKTSARVCIGECSAGAGCWPTNGELSQIPYGVGTPDDDASHRPPVSGGYADAYDIASINLPNVYAPFAGDLCFVACSDTGFGCHVNLDIGDQKLKFAHFEEAPHGMSPNECFPVEEGFLIGPMGNRGWSTGPHLHYEVDYNGAFYHPSSRSFSVLETLVPETDQGNYPPPLGNTVTTCYE